MPPPPSQESEMGMPLPPSQEDEVGMPPPSSYESEMRMPPYIYIYIYIYIYVYIYIDIYILDISPCPFLKKVEVTSGGGGATVSFKAVKVTSSAHSS